MTAPADKNLHRVMSDQWARRMKPRNRRTDIMDVVLIVLVIASVVIIGAAAFGRGMADAEASIEIGPEGVE